MIGLSRTTATATITRNTTAAAAIGGRDEPDPPVLPVGAGVPAGSIDPAGEADATADSDAAGATADSDALEVAGVAEAVTAGEAEGVARSPAGTQPDGATRAYSPKLLTIAVNMSGMPAGSVGTAVQLPPEKISILADGRLVGPRNSTVILLPDWMRATVVIFVMVLLGVVLRFFQEMRADNAAEKLKAWSAPRPR